MEGRTTASAQAWPRTEIQVMIGELLRRFESIEITGDPVWLSSGAAINVGVAVQSLPVHLE